MTVAELIRELKGCVQDSKVFCEYDGINSDIRNVTYKVREIDFSDDETEEAGYVIEHGWS